MGVRLSLKPGRRGAVRELERAKLALLVAMLCLLPCAPSVVAQPSADLRALDPHPGPPAAPNLPAPAVSVSGNGSGGSDLSRTTIDLSSHNALMPITEQLSATFGIELLFHRATIGIGTPDAVFADRLNEATRMGFHVGAYHVIYPGHSGADQADEFLNVVARACQVRTPVLLAVDWEPVCTRRAKGKRGKCLAETIVEPAVVSDFVERIRTRTSVQPIIYTSRRTIEAERANINASLTSSPLWYATYYTKFWRRAENDDAGHNEVDAPAGAGGRALHLVSRIGYVIPLAEDVRPWADWSLWQFGEGKGPDVTSKISLRLGRDPVDMSFYNGGRQAFERFVGVNAWDCRAPAA
jgi:GH25 family lysozyme M1 (1,4-beta-N-acetylmuramidase)